MSTIRRQSIISSLVIYFGFAVGMLNTYFFTKEGLFTAEEYGLTSIFIAIATLMTAFATLAMPSYIFKFYHYYNDHLPPKKNDMITWSLLVGIAGFIIVIIAGIIFKHLVIRKFGGTPQLLTYYYWIFPMGFGYTIFAILEAYTWNLGKSVFTNFLREVQWRLFTSILIIFFIAGFIGEFEQFIKLFAFTYPAIAIILFFYLFFTKKIHFTFRVSKVSRRLFSKILTLCAYIYSGTIIMTLSMVFDTIVIASVLPQGVSKAGIFNLAVILTSVIQAPQRGIISASVSHLSKGWKDKNMGLLQRIYKRSSINQLVFASGLFLLICLNFTDAITTFRLKEIYLDGFFIFFFLGISKVIDMGTGLNAEIIATSNYWRFQMISGVILLVIMLPLTYIMAKQFDVIGPAIATLISISIYNMIRIIFLWKKFRLFPFSSQSIYTIVLAAVCFAICYFGFKNLHGIMGMAIRSLVFAALYASGAIYLKLSPDIQPVLQTIRNRLKFQKQKNSRN